MEGNFKFNWEVVDACGRIEGKYEQTIFGESLAAAIETFSDMHGTLSPDEDGACIVITFVSWEPYKES